MYYGIAGGAQVYVDCKMNYQEVNAWDHPMSTLMAMDKEWTLTSKYDDLTVKVSVRTYGNDDRRVVISVLLAGLKQIEDSEIYDASVAAIETKLGFRVDKSIPAGLGTIVDTVMWNDRVEYEVVIGQSISSMGYKEPKLHVEHIQDTMKMRVVMEIESNYQKLKSAFEFDVDTWIDNQGPCLDYAKHILLESFYEKNYSPHLTYLKYYILGDEMNGASPESMHIAMDGQGWTHLGFIEDIAIPEPHKFTVEKPPVLQFGAYSGAYVGGHEEDDRVKELPALREMVKHPITQKTDRLKSVIISLNDGAKWTREQIADWLETLDVDITFKTKESNEQN